MALTRLSTALPLVRKATTDPTAMTAEYVVSFPCDDLAGDYVEPAGLDPAVHKSLRAWVGLEHYRQSADGSEWVLPGPRDNHLSPVVVGTAFGPDGNYSLQVKAMPEGPVAFGKTWFAKTRLGEQTYRLVEDGTLQGTSVEFTLRKGQYTERGRSPLEDRPAYHVRSADLLGWVHCATPVNPGALTLTKSLPAHAEQARRVVELGRVGSDPAHPLILKALSRFVPAGKPTTVTGGYAAPRLEKAMDDTAAPAMDPAYETEPDAAPAAGGSTPTVQALYQLAQGLQDMKAQVEEMLAGSEHVKGKKFATKLLADLDATVEDATEMAAKIEAELGQTEAEPAGDEEPAEPEPDIAADDTDPDDDGVLKCIARRPAVFKAIRRFTLAEVRKAAPVTAPEATPEPAADDLVAQFAALQQTDPDAYDRLCRRATRKLSVTR
jgi:hypothetical protein